MPEFDDKGVGTMDKSVGMVELISFFTIAFVCVILPLIVFGILFVKTKGKRVRLTVLFLIGAVIYFATQWLIKEKGCMWLIRNTNIFQKLYDYYFMYIFVIALIGTIVLFLTLTIVFRYIYKSNYDLSDCISIGLGYSICEAVLVAGITSINCIISYFNGTQQETSPYVGELFLSAYERVIVTMIHIGLISVLAYMIQKKKGVAGFVLVSFAGALFDFLPDFFLSFSTSAFLELYSRNVALIMIYLVLTTAAVTSFAILFNICYKFSYQPKDGKN